MRKSLRLTCLLLLCCTVPSLAQVWSYAYGGAGSELGKFIEPTSDGGFYVAGTQSAVSQGPERFYVARFNAAGALLWEKSYGKTGSTHTIFAFSKTSDDGFLIGGFTGVQNSGTESALMYRADSAGNVVFERDVNYSDSDHWHVLLERPEGGYYMGGHTDSRGDPSGDMWLQKLDESRAVIWEKVYNRNTSEHAHSGVIARDGDVVLLGHTAVGGREKYWVTKVDTTGTIRWQKVFGSVPNDHDSPYKTFETREGNFAFIGGSSTPNQPLGTMWLLVVDAIGNIVIDKHYGAAGGQTFSWSGRQTSDGGFILAGHTNYRTRGQLDMIVVKTDALGNQEWERTYGGTGYDYAFDVIEVADGYIAAGYTGSPSIMTGGGGDLYIVKIAKETQALPTTVVLRTPTNGAVNQPSNARLAWNAVSGASRYELQVALDSTFESKVYADTNIAATADTLAALTSGMRYFWRIRAINSVGAGPWSNIWSFATALPLPSAVVLLSPAHGESTSTDVTLTWEAAQPNVEKYWLETSSTQAFTTRGTDTNIVGTSTPYNGLERGRTYWWRVKARNSSGWGPFSQPRSFTVSPTTAVTGELATTSSNMTVWPNPVSSNASVRFSLSSPSDVVVVIADVTGRTVLSMPVGYRSTGEHRLMLDASSIAPGAYALVLRNSAGIVAVQGLSVVR